MVERSPAQTGPSSRLLAAGQGWRVCEVVCRSGPGDRPFPELHTWSSVAAVISGAFTYRSHRGRALMTPGSLLLGNAGTCFECGHEHGTGDRCIAFHLAPDLIQETLAALDGRTQGRFTYPSLPPLERLLPLGTEAQALAASPDPLRAESLALDVARTAFALDAGLRPRQASSLREEAKAAEAVRIVDAYYVEPLSVAELAHRVGLGRQGFALAFRCAVGVTPYNYILRRRLQAAAEQLRTSSRTVLDIALDVGFGDLSEFNRRFKRRFGVAPSAYRRQEQSCSHPMSGARTRSASPTPL